MRLVSSSLRAVLAAAALVSLAATGLAQGSGTADGGSEDTSTGNDTVPAKYPDIGWYDLHNHNRAVAFGSVLMQAAGGNVGAWQEIRAYGWCADGKIDMPVPSRPVDDETPATGGGDGSSSDGGSSNGDNDVSSCGWSVLFTTQYSLQVCPNGRAFILRSGEGVDVKSRSEGDTFAWAEAAFCDDSGPLLTSANTQDPHRVLDLKRVSRVPLR